MAAIDSVHSDDLRAAVAAARSWRGVLRELGLTESSSRLGRLLRERCDELGIDYSHLTRGRRWRDEDLVRAVSEASSWQEVLRALGYQPGSGTARATVRGTCVRLAVDTGHLDLPRPEKGSASALLAGTEPRNLRDAGPLIVAGLLTLKGCRISWPLEPAPYDLVVDDGSASLLRVQVKTTTYRAAGTWMASINRSAYSAESRWASPRVYGIDDIDHFAIVDGDLDVYLIPSAVVGGRKSIALRRYRAFVIGVAPVEPVPVLPASQEGAAPFDHGSVPEGPASAVV